MGKSPTLVVSQQSAFKERDLLYSLTNKIDQQALITIYFIVPYDPSVHRGMM